MILPREGKLFEEHIEDLIKLLDDEDHRQLFKLPSDWSVGINDKGLLNAVAENGLKYLKDVRYSHEYGLNACRVNQKRLQRRVEFMCNYFKNVT
jgi:hypothetical protein